MAARLLPVTSIVCIPENRCKTCCTPIQETVIAAHNTTSPPTSTYLPRIRRIISSKTKTTICTAKLTMPPREADKSSATMGTSGGGGNAAGGAGYSGVVYITEYW